MKNIERVKEIETFDESPHREVTAPSKGSAKPGGVGGVCYTVANGDGWTQQKTADDLGISQHLRCRPKLKKGVLL